MLKQPIFFILFLNMDLYVLPSMLFHLQLKQEAEAPWKLTTIKKNLNQIFEFILEQCVAK